MASDRMKQRLSNQAVAQLVSDRWERSDNALVEERRNYWINLAFYRGHQLLRWDPVRRIAEMRADVETGSQRVQTVVNKIQPRLDHLVGRLAAKPLAFEVPPTAPDDSTVAGARLAEQLLSAEHDDDWWESTRREGLYNTFFGGVAAVSVEWDPKAQRWLTDNDQMAGSGAPKLRPLSVAEFALEPGSRRAQDSTWWISCIAMPPEQAREHYHLGYTPKGDATTAYSPLQRTLLRERGAGLGVELTNVFTMFERPTDRRPEGLAAVVINGNVVYRDKWPFPFTDLNLHLFRQKPLPGTWTGATMMTAARSSQVAYNFVRSIILEHAKLAGNARMLVPHGSLDAEQDLTDEAGEIIEYYPLDGAAPHFMTPAELSRYVYQQGDIIERELDDIMHTNEVARGIAPGDRNSGLALSILAERNDSPLSTMAQDQANGWARIASQVLRLYGEHVTEQRTATVWVGGVPQELRWNGVALRNQYRVIVPLESTSPQSRSARIAQLMEIKRSFPEVFAGTDPNHMAQMLDMPAAHTLAQLADADVARATKENCLIAAGEVVSPEPYDDHARHIAEHNRMRKSDAYLYAATEIREVMDLHIEAHQRLVEEEAISQAALNDAVPGLGGLPQGNEPIGSAVPPDAAEQMGGML